MWANYNFTPYPKEKKRKAPSQNKTEEMCEIQHINSMKAIVKIGFRVASIKLKQKDKMELFIIPTKNTPKTDTIRSNILQNNFIISIIIRIYR